MAEPSYPLSTPVETPEPSSPLVTKEEVEVNAPGKNLSVLKWLMATFETLMRDIQMPPEYGATYPQEGDTTGDAPAGYVTMFVDFFGDCNLRLALTIFVAEILEYYKLHISQLSPLGMIQVRNFEYMFRALGIVPILWVLRMMLGRMSRKARPDCGKRVEAPLWRMFCPDFMGEVEIVAYADDEEGFNRTIRNNFRLPDRAALEAVLSEGKGDLGALGDPAATGVPKQPVLKLSDKRQRKPKKPHEAVVVPPLVPEVASISRTLLRKYDDYVIVSDTLEGLGVPSGAAAAGGSTTSAELIDVKKWKGDAPAAGEQKAPKLRKTRVTTVPMPKLSVTTEPREESISFFAAPPSPPKEVDVEGQKKGEDSPSIEVVSGGGTPPSVHTEDTLK
ncbi:hypothetical protein Hdeb2414_s0007g00245121 [Helianthus debilis subsp. tardiflorus]